MLLAPSDEICPEHLQPPGMVCDTCTGVVATDAYELTYSEAKREAIGRFDREYLQAILVQEAGNVSRAAERANKDRSSLSKLLKKHDINPAAFRID
jgi:DNA-binding NtrC family response regulator